MQDTQDKPAIDEQYATAIHASNLRVEGERRSQADVLMAYAWSPVRVGGALLRLHSEWDAAAHPRKGTPGYMHEMGLLLGKLKVLPDVRYQLEIKVQSWAIEDARTLTSLVLIWWLDRACPACHGVRWKAIANTPSLSGKFCPRCHGTGQANFPAQSEAARLVNYMETCMASARQQARGRMWRNVP